MALKSYFKCNEDGCLACKSATLDLLVSKCSGQTINDRLSTADEITTYTHNVAKQCQRLPKMSPKRSYCAVFLFICVCVILVQNSGALPASIGVTASGQRLILHTPSYRQRYHQQLLQQHRTNIQTTVPHHRHHLHHRALDNMPETSTESAYKQFLGDVDIFHKNTDQAVDEYLREAFNTSKTKEEMDGLWLNHFLGLKHPFHEGLNTKLFQEEFYARIQSEQITCADAKQKVKDLFYSFQMLNKMTTELMGDPTKFTREQNIPAKDLETEKRLLNRLSEETMRITQSISLLLNAIGENNEYTTSAPEYSERKKNGILWLLSREIMCMFKLTTAYLTAMSTYCASSA